MLLYCLKHEFREHRTLTLVWLMLMSLFPLLNWLWWSTPVEDYDPAKASFAGLTLLASITQFIHLTQKVIKKDDLKNYQAFWTTRPMRPKTLYTAKWIYIQLVITLPISIAFSITAIVIDRPELAITAGLEYGLWAFFSTSLIAYSAIVKAGKGYFLCAGLFIFGAIATLLALAITYPENYSPSIYDVGINLLIILSLLSVLFTYLYFWQIYNRHKNLGWWLMPLIGAVASAIAIHAPIPVSRSGSNSVDSCTLNSPQTHEMTLSDKGTLGDANRLRFSTQANLPSQLPTVKNSSILSQNLTFRGMDSNLKGFYKITPHVYASRGSRYLEIDLDIYDRVPNSSNKSSSSAVRNSNAVNKLPKIELHLEGHLIIQADYLRDLPPFPLNAPLRISEPGLQLTTSINRLDNIEISISTKRSKLPLLSKDPKAHHVKPSFKTSHPKAHIDFSDSGSSRNYTSGFIAHQSNYSFDLFNDTSPQSHELKKLRKQGFKGSAQDWINEASQIISVYDHSTYYKIEVDLTIEIPDPAKIIEIIREGRVK